MHIKSELNFPLSTHHIKLQLLCELENTVLNHKYCQSKKPIFIPVELFKIANCVSILIGLHLF